MQKKLYRNSKEGMFGGVLLGFSEYFGGDVTLWRMGFLLLVIATGVFPLIVAYIIALFVMPERPDIEPLSKEEYVVYD